MTVKAITLKTRASTRDLSQKLSEAEATIQALLSGQIDAMVDAKSKTVVLLSKAQDALLESEERKAAVLDSVVDCIVTMDADGTVIEFNTAAEHTFGYTKAEAIGRPLAELIIPPQMRAAHNAGMASTLATGEGPLLGTLTEVTAMRSDGSEIPVELRITAVRSAKATIFTGVLRDITARKQADENRARLAAIVDSSDDAIFSSTLDGTIVTWNAGAERLHGYSASELIGRTASVMIPGDKQAELATILEGVRRGKASEPFETKRNRKDGSVIDVSVTISPMMDPAGRVTGRSTIARDITSRKHAESALNQERDRAQRYLDTAQVILLALDIGGRITMVNRYACAIFGRSERELLGRDFIETCVPPRLREDTRTKLRAVHGGPDSSIVDNPIVTNSGDERMIEWRNTLLRDADGCVVGTISSGSDVTDRNRASESLRVAEERTRYAMQASGVGLWDMDYASGVLTWSETLESQCGLKAGTFDGTFEAFADCIHPDDRKTTLETIGKALQTGSDFTVQNRAVWPDGTVRWLSGSGSVRLGEHGEPVRAVGIFMDVTERRLLEEQYQQAQKMEAVGRLAGGVAHDFNNLLMVITGYSDILLQGLMPADPRRQDLEQIKKASDAATSLTRQLLAFSRQQVIELRDVVLEDAVEGATKMLQRLIGEDVDLVTSLSPVPVTVRIDPGQLEQIIMNLVVNARDAMPTGGKLTIETAIVELTQQDASAHWPVTPGRFALLAVSDTGVGMDEKTRAKIFEPFFTTKGQGKGTGLGLATVYGIVKQSNGFIWVYSEPGQGATFKVYFPVIESAPATDQLGKTEEITPRGVETILLVEDSDGVRDIARRVLERQGYHVLVASSASGALELARGFSGTIHLLLTDVVMPEMSGRVLSETFAQEYPDAKVLFMSGYTDDAVVRHGVLQAETPYLQKPFSPHALAGRVRELLDAA